MIWERKKVYEKCGVKEYWIVDPGTRSVQGFFLENNQYQQAVKMEGKIASRRLNAEFNF